jgi:hypothetical protein
MLNTFKKGLIVYGDKRDYRRIEIYVNGEYKGTTTWSKTCKEAIDRYILQNVETDIERDKVRAYFAD